jgi:hypothetical protein
MSDYQDILNRSWGEMPESKNLPVGFWLLRAQNAVFKPGGENMNDRVLFFYTAVEPSDDVDEDAIAELGPDYDYTENDIVHTFWVEKARDWRNVEDHLALHGIDDKELTVAASLKAVKGTSVMGYLDVRTFEDRAGNMRTENNITAFKEVE